MALMSSIFLLEETLPSKLATKYTRLQQRDEEQGGAWPRNGAPLASEGASCLCPPHAAPVRLRRTSWRGGHGWWIMGQDYRVASTDCQVIL